MAKKNKETFGYLGREFQIRLLNHILTDHKFANSILDILLPNYFDDEYLRLVSASIIDTWAEHEYIPDYSGLEIILRGEVKNEQIRELVLLSFKEVKESSLIGGEDIKKRSLWFCKQQALKETLGKIQKIIDSGDVERYPECEEMMKEALELGDNKDDATDVFEGIDEVLSDDFRKPVPTGIEGLDFHMDGGLAPSELGVILAPFGVGKTTMVTKIANSAKNMGKNVLQIFFEDNPKSIKRKHLTCWHNLNDEYPKIVINDINNHKDTIKEIAKQEAEKDGQIKLKKFPSDGTTVPQIRQYIRKLIASGFKLDMVLIDYVDCLVSSKHFTDQNHAEGHIMRQIETMLTDFNIVGWACIQGNRSAINANVVDSTMIGGSIKRGQIGHFIVSLAKSLTQKEEGKATMAILKSRFGIDGLIFEDCIFDNRRLIIDTSEAGDGKSFLEAEEGNKKEADDRVSQLLSKRKQKLSNGVKDLEKEIDNNDNK